MKTKNKVNYIELDNERERATRNFIIIIIGIIVLGLIGHWVGNWIRESSWNEQTYCERNSQDCSITKIERYSFEEIKKENCINNLIEKTISKNPIFYCKIHQKKNPCQLFLEKKGWLDTDCVCSEWREKIKCLEWEKRENVNDTYYKMYGIPCIKKVLDNPDCIKAREKTECEKGNPKYIPDCEEGFEYTEVFYTCYKYPEGFTKEPVCRKKTFEDLSCSELSNVYNKGCIYRILHNEYPNICKGEIEVLKRMIKLGCFK